MLNRFGGGTDLRLDGTNDRLTSNTIHKSNGGNAIGSMFKAQVVKVSVCVCVCDSIYSG